MKNVLTLLVVLLFTLPVASCRAEDNQSEFDTTTSKPYKATTVNECIREKECVWEAFKTVLLSEDIYRPGDETVEYASRWKAPISIKLIGPRKDKLKITLTSLINILQEFVPHEMAFQSPYNFLIVFSEDMEFDLTTRYREQFQKMTGDDSIYERYQDVKDYGVNDCFFIRYKEKGEMKAVFMFVDLKDKFFNYCIIRNFYAGLGNKGSLEDFEFSGFQINTQNKPQMTNVDQLILKILYELHYTEDSAMKDIRKHFDEIYLDVLKRYLHPENKLEERA